MAGHDRKYQETIDRLQADNDKWEAAVQKLIVENIKLVNLICKTAKIAHEYHVSLSPKPCPSCDAGGRDVVCTGDPYETKDGTVAYDQIWFYRCRCCGVRGPEAETKEEALTVWNALPRKIR